MNRLLKILSVLAVCLTGTAANATEHIVEMTDTPPYFTPASLTVQIGDTVVWKNHGPVLVHIIITVIRYYGIEGLQHHIREHVRLAQQFAAWVRDDSRLELAAPAQLNLVCFRLRSGDSANQLLMERLNGSGDLYLTHTKLDGKLSLRLCVGQTNTQARHVERAWQRIQQETGNLGNS